MRIGILGGTFNPVHIGHLIIANHIVEFTDLKKVWLVITPENPLKKGNLLNEYERLHLVNLALDRNPKLMPCTIEFNLPRPSYTIDTLTYLREKFPLQKFSLIMGSDNLVNLNKWKNHEHILENFEIYIYQRKNFSPDQYAGYNNIYMTEAPILEVSSSLIRNMIREGKSVRYLVPEKVYRYIEEMNLYRQ